MRNTRPKIRAVSVTAIALTLAALTLTGCTSSRSTVGQVASGCDTKAFTAAKIDWKAFSGQTLNVAGESNPWVTAIKPKLQCFHDLTGINVKLSTLGEDQYVSRVAVGLSSGAKTPDVFMINQFGQAAGSGWLQPLDSYLSNKKLTDASWYDKGDIFPGASKFGQQGGKTLALPISAEVEMLYVRTDLVKQVPTTMDELASAAKAANKDGVAGFGARAVASASQSPWTFAGFSFSSGGQLLNSAGKPELDSPANVTALTQYADLIKDDGAPGASGWGFLENQQAMQQGKLAMWVDSSSLLGSVKDTSTSTDAKNISIYPLPSGAAGSKPNLYYWTIGINSKSTHKDAAWLFSEWSTSKALAKQIGEVGGSPARASAWKDPKLVNGIGQENAQRIQQVLTTADPTGFSTTWKQTSWGQISDPVARAINAAVSGTDPKAALQTAQTAAEGIAK